MHIKLLGSTGILTVAVFALATQYGEASQTSPLPTVVVDHSPLAYNRARPSLTETSAVATSVAPLLRSHHPELFTEQAFDDIARPQVADRLRRMDVPKQVVMASNKTPVKIMTSFATASITGVLQSKGFSRPEWQLLANKLPLNTKRKQNTFVVMLDPGHGGIDPGSEAHNGLLEKNLTLDIAKRARLFLSEFEGFEVILTRNHDNGLSRQSRVDAIKQSKADMVISLHFNHLPQADLTLVESFYAGPENIAESQAKQMEEKNLPAGLRQVAAAPMTDLRFTQGSARLAHSLQQRVFNEVSFDNPEARNAGVKKDTLFVLTRSFTPGVLMELTCLSNINEANKLATDEYRDRLAAALVDGIRNYRDSLEQRPLDTLTDTGV